MYYNIKSFCNKLKYNRLIYSFYKINNRALQKQKSRENDEQLIVTGKMSLKELDDKNAFLRANRTIVHWNKAKRL